MKSLKIASEEKRIVWAEVYVPDVPDTDGEFMDAEGIEKMAYDFMQNLRLKQCDLRHNNNLVDGACIVESFIARKDDPDGFIEGAWVVGMYVPDDDVWAMIKKGEINGFSMEAMVKKRNVEIELTMPPVISGRTMKHDDEHDHEFFVSYDDEGNFLGGKTSIVKGHYHEIRRGTVTETTAGHNHRFAHIDKIKAQEVK